MTLYKLLRKYPFDISVEIRVNDTLIDIKRKSRDYLGTYYGSQDLPDKMKSMGYYWVSSKVKKYVVSEDKTLLIAYMKPTKMMLKEEARAIQCEKQQKEWEEFMIKFEVKA